MVHEEGIIHKLLVGKSEVFVKGEIFERAFLNRSFNGSNKILFHGNEEK